MNLGTIEQNSIKRIRQALKEDKLIDFEMS